MRPGSEGAVIHSFACGRVRDAAYWIAMNGEPMSGHSQREIAHYVTVGLVADIFHRQLLRFRPVPKQPQVDCPTPESRRVAVAYMVAGHRRRNGMPVGA